jgi:hypothetical protein
MAKLALVLLLEATAYAPVTRLAAIAQAITLFEMFIDVP